MRHNLIKNELLLSHLAASSKEEEEEGETSGSHSKCNDKKKKKKNGRPFTNEPIAPIQDKQIIKSPSRLHISIFYFYSHH